MARYLVTGATGFIGSNLSTLLSEKHEVVGLCNSLMGTQDNLRDFKGKFIHGDIRSFDYASLGKFDAIFHQAAISDTTVMDRKLMFSTNVDAFVTILEYAKATGCSKVVYASSAATYGKGKVPMSEKDVPAPANIYGESKVEMEKAAKKFAEKAPSMSIVGLRYFNVYGPREAHKLKTASMVYQLYNQIVAGKAPRIFKMGEQFRDFIYVKDVVLANLKALEFPERGDYAFNVGTGIPTSFNQVIAALNSALKADKPTDYIDNPYTFYQDQTQADMAYSESLLKFRCQFSPETGIQDYVKILKGSTVPA